MSSFDIFISYNWKSKDQVKLLYDKLNNDYLVKIWMDDGQISNDNLLTQIADAIKKSTIFLCCITKKYAESDICRKEISYANTLKKRFIVLMLENLKMDDLGDVGFIINTESRFNCYKEPDFFANFNGGVFNSIFIAIKNTLAKESSVLIYPNGDRYQGDLVDGLAHGEGLLMYKNGINFYGIWINGKMNGSGKLNFPNGDKYEGDVLDGLGHGKGTMTYKNGVVFYGDWVDGQMNGKAVLKFPKLDEFKNVRTYVGEI